MARKLDRHAGGDDVDDERRAGPADGRLSACWRSAIPKRAACITTPAPAAASVAAPSAGCTGRAAAGRQAASARSTSAGRAAVYGAATKPNRLCQLRSAHDGCASPRPFVPGDLACGSRPRNAARPARLRPIPTAREHDDAGLRRG